MLFLPVVIKNISYSSHIILLKMMDYVIIHKVIRLEKSPKSSF